MAKESEEKKTKPVVTEDEIERIIRELEKREEARIKAQEEERKRRKIEAKEREKREREELKQKEKQQITAKPSIFKPPILAKPPPQLPPTLAPKKPIAKKVPQRHPFKSFIKYVLIFILLAILFYLGLNYKSYLLNAQYIYKTKIRKISPPSSVSLPEIPETKEINLPDSLIIPKLQVQVPIIWQIEENDVIKELKNGVVNFKGTALPIEDGNIVIIGHSSSYPWQKGKYDQVFALLEKLAEKDKIIIIYQKRKYVYEVAGKKIIKPDQFEIKKSTSPSLTLITCWPVGTSFRRLIISANQIEKPTQTMPEHFLPNAP